MFFAERIKNIKIGDKVLEIGPGTTPYSRSNVLLEKRYEDSSEHLRQCGGVPASESDVRTVYYDGGIFPFDDNEFDYVICSHVIEHVEDVEMFCSEMFRVARSGYLEYPLIYYDYVFDIPEHVNVLMRVNDDLVYCKKADIFPQSLKPIQKFWYMALVSGYTDTATDLIQFTMQGFEWTRPFNVRQSNKIDDLLLTSFNIPPKPQKKKSFIRLVLSKFKSLI